MADPAGGGPRGPHRRTDTSDPHRSRVRALKILFQADVRREPADATLDGFAAQPGAHAFLDTGDVDDDAAASQRGPAIDGFTRALVVGVAEHVEELDALIARFARRWQISRMPVVDRSVLRLATYELLHEDTPAPVVIDEAVTLAKAMSTDDSGRYVNGVLDAIRKDLAARPPGTTGDAAEG